LENHDIVNLKSWRWVISIGETKFHWTSIPPVCRWNDNSNYGWWYHIIFTRILVSELTRYQFYTKVIIVVIINPPITKVKQIFW